MSSICNTSIFCSGFNYLIITNFFYYEKNPRLKKIKKCRVRALEGCPQRRGFILEVKSIAPKKPNSAKRKVAFLHLFTKKDVYAYVPGIGHSLLKFNKVLIRGGKNPDLPGVRYVLIRGVFDFKGVLKRFRARSKYGVRNFKKAPRTFGMRIEKKSSNNSN